MEKQIWKIVSLGLILLACLGGCVWITYNQVEKYLAKTSFVGTSYQPRNVSFPDLMFCHGQPFKRNKNILDIENLSLETYKSVSEPMPEVTFDLILRNNLNATMPKNYKVLSQATKFNGNCKIFQVDLFVEEKVYYTFTYPEGQELILLILPRDEYIYAIGHNWQGLPPDILSIEGDKQIEMEVNEFTYLPKVVPNRKPCDVQVTENEFMDCLRTELGHFLEQHDFDCMPHFFRNFLRSSKPDCEEGSVLSKLLYRFHSKLLVNYAKHQVDVNCNHPCTSSWFDLVSLDLMYIDNTDNFTDRNRVLFSLSTSLVSVATESYLYDFTAIVSSIGGGVGIFLGFSCFGMISSALSKLYAKFHA